MKATVVDLRYRMKEVLRALDRREQVTLLHHGKVRGKIVPAANNRMSSVQAHPFFNMTGKASKTVAQEMDELRGSRFHDL